MLTAQRKLTTLCERYGLELTDLAKHSNKIGLDIQGIDDHVQHIHQVGHNTCFPDNFWHIPACVGLDATQSGGLNAPFPCPPW